MRRTCHLDVIIVLLISSILKEAFCQEVPAEIILSVTYRDFLPIWCLNTPLIPDGVTKIEEAWDSFDSLISSNSDACERLLDESISIDNSYRLALQAGSISGHPDFEASGLFTAQPLCTSVDPNLGVNFPIGSCIFDGDINEVPIIEQSIVSSNLAQGENGLPPIQYCKDNGPDTRCGFIEFGGQTQTTKQYFDAWYNDDAVYNRRIGQRFRLTQSSSFSNAFEFVDEGPESPDFANETISNNNQFGPLDIFKVGGSREVDLEAVSPEECPAWPQSATGGVGLSRGFWFTSEIHTTFQYKSDEEMFLLFSGDDDFWAFINGRLALDIGGLHVRREQEIELNSGDDAITGGRSFAELLDLEDGGVYDLDIYHAERQRTGSNFELITSLVPPCNVHQIGKVSFDFRTGFNETTFHEMFLGEGVVLTSSNTFQLLQSGDNFTGNHVFTVARENVGSGFDAEFLATIDGETEGFAFVIQSSINSDYPTTLGKSFNINVPNSVAIVFDLCASRNIENSCNSQEVRVHFPEQSNNTNNADIVDIMSGGTRRVFDSILRNVKRNEPFPVRIVYYGGHPDYLEVFVNNSLYLRQTDFDIQAAIGANTAYVGFTASTLDLAANIFIENFNLKVVEPDATRTKFLPGQEEIIQSVVSDGKAISDGFKLFTEDACGRPFGIGGFGDLIDAKFIELPNDEGRYNSGGSIPLILVAVISDNLDGTYNIGLQTTIAAEYALALTFGAGCSLELIQSVVNLNIDNESVEIVLVSPSLAGDIELCSLIADFNGTVLAVPPPPTSAPTNSPTPSPSLSPTINPTTSPSVTPTNSPSLSPTASPTMSPTANPTVTPTKNPTESPTTRSPTSSPIVSLTFNPTAIPTKSPTENPVTNSPTEESNDDGGFLSDNLAIISFICGIISLFIGLSFFVVSKFRKTVATSNVATNEVIEIKKVAVGDKASLMENYL